MARVNPRNNKRANALRELRLEEKKAHELIVYSKSSFNFRQRLAIEPSPARMTITPGPSNAGPLENIQEEWWRSALRLH